jgi:hypothetical protein
LHTSPEAPAHETDRGLRLRAGQGRPVFLFCGGGGNIRELQPLVAALRTRRPLVGILYWEPLKDGSPPSTVESMADGALQTILRNEPVGPYSLVGYSLGGLVAVEVARRLVERGHASQPILIDPLTDKADWPFTIFVRAGVRYLFHKPFHRLSETRSVGPPEKSALDEVEKRCRDAKARYRPSRYDGPIAVLHAAREPYVGGLTPGIWRRIALRADCIAMPASHLELMRSEPLVAELAQTVDRLLDEGEKRRALVLTGVSWGATARLAGQLHRVGFTVEAVAPARHPLARQKSLAAFHVLRATEPLRSIETAIMKSRPDMLFPGDDFVTDLLHRLHRDTEDVGVRATIERSLGNPEFYGRKFDRLWMNDLAASEGIGVPRTVGVASPAQLGEQLDKVGLPAFLKVDGSWGGLGVTRIERVSDSKRAWRRLTGRRHGLRAVKRALFNGDVSGVDRLLRRRRPFVSLQAAVEGQLVIVSAACYRGELLGLISARVLAQQTAFGPATKIEMDDQLPVREAVARIIRRLGLSGLCGLDFIVSSTQTPHFIELNPRATQTSDFMGETDGDFLSALLDRLGGRGKSRCGVFSNGSVITMATVTDEDDSHLPEPNRGAALRTL